MKKELILSDLDGTLTNKSLALCHAGFLIDRGLITDDGSYSAWKKDAKNEELIVAVAENYRKEIVGKTEEDMLSREFIISFIEDKSNWYETFKELDTRASNVDLVLVTGSADFLVKFLSDYLGCKYFATKYIKDEYGKFTGEIRGMFTEKHKDKVVQTKIDISKYDYIQAWGDTNSDYGLFKHADYKVLVHPTTETLARLIQKTTIDKVII